MCQATKYCQSDKAAQSQQQSNSSSSCSHRGSIHSYALLMALAALLTVPTLTQARHLHDLGLAYDEDVSDSSSDSSLPAWHANPFHGLEQSFGSYDEEDISSSGGSSSSSSGSGSSESESSYERIIEAALQAAMREQRRLRQRHRRSHLLRFFARSQLEAASAPPEWENPCGGVYQPDESQSAAAAEDNSSQGRMIKRTFLMALRNNTMREYEYMRTNAALNYGAFEHWQHEYKFLPNMTRPSSLVKLKTWYRHVQTFVGSFAYLGKAHYKYRKEHQLSLDGTTHELHELLVSARRVLCEIETTINSSYPNSHGAKLSQVSRAAMAERLKFYTPADGSKEADVRDLKFSKQLYLQYLDNMWKSLRRSMRRHHRNSMERRQHAANDAAAAAVASAASASGSSSGSGSLQAFSMESSESSSAAAAAGAGATLRRT